MQKILKIAHVAPTVVNRQPVRLVVVRSWERLSAVSESANIYGAPVAVVVCADKSKAWTCPFVGMVTRDIDALHSDRPHDAYSYGFGAGERMDLLF